MGTGASKKATADAEKASFDDDDTDEDFDTYSKKKVAANSKSFSRHSVTMFPISVHSKFLILSKYTNSLVNTTFGSWKKSC